MKKQYISVPRPIPASPDSMVTTHRGNDVGTGAIVSEPREHVSGIAGHDCNTEWWAPKGTSVATVANRVIDGTIWRHWPEKHCKHPGTHFQLPRQS